MASSQERWVETTTAGVILSSFLALGMSGAHSEEAALGPQQITTHAPSPTPHITVESRASTDEFEQVFGCDIQNDMRPDSTGQHWASAREKSCAQHIAAVIGKNSYGWDHRQQQALVTLWTHESAWSANADNAHSSAYGIPQAMTSQQLHGPELTKEFGNGAFSYYKNPVSQIQWGLQYIHKRYGTPVAANNFWHDQCGSKYGCWY